MRLSFAWQKRSLFKNFKAEMSQHFHKHRFIYQQIFDTIVQHFITFGSKNKTKSVISNTRRANL